MPHVPAQNRYEATTYNRCGRSGLKLPAISLGLWHNFGDATPHETKRAIVRTAFDLGITHFDLANTYGPPPGGAETAFGRLLREDFSAHRDEMIVSTKAGYTMWAGPYGDKGSRKYLLSSLDQSLKRLGLDHVDIFYHHRPDTETPLEETMGALAHAVRQGKALYVGISNYKAEAARQAAKSLRELGVPCLICQPSYSMINRGIEKDGLLDALDAEGMGSIVFSPLAQGVLTARYIHGVPTDSRAAAGRFLKPAMLTPELMERVRALDEIAGRRGQTLAEMALAWVLRGGRVTSALIGASRPSQVVEAVGALKNPEFTEDELAEIDRYAF